MIELQVCIISWFLFQRIFTLYEGVEGPVKKRPPNKKDETFQISHEDNPVTESCLNCICEAMTRCNPDYDCTDEGPCGGFRITRTYWLGSQRPTVADESPDNISAFKTCVRSRICSSLAIQNYMSIHQKDCNGDNKIDCDDFVRLHINGNDCTRVNITEIQEQNYLQCKENILQTRLRP